ncbi:MAG: PilZ domain-containing protein [Treponema sp.]|nr:PilZ domain-containing protein [Treponema sp.]
MALVTTQQLQDYYDHYRDSEITFSKEITNILNVDPRQIYVKCNGNQWPCIINSTSLMACRIIVGVKGGAYAMLSQKETGPVSVRFCFSDSDKQMISFFVNGRVSDIKPYMNSAELSIITISFTQRPPDDLIERLGTLLDANANAMRRKDERIIVNADVKRKLGLAKEEAIIQIQGVPRHCIIRDLSFGGAKLIMMGIQKYVENQQALLQMRFEEPGEVIQVGGVVVATSPVEGRKDILIVSIKFGDKTVPIAYKIRINNYLANLRKHAVAPAETTEQKLAAAKAAQEKAVAAEKARMEAEEKAKQEGAAASDGSAPADAATADAAAPAPAQEEAKPDDAASAEKAPEGAPASPEEAAPVEEIKPEESAPDAAAAENK